MRLFNFPSAHTHCPVARRFCLDLVREEQCTSVCTKITPIPVLSETTKRQDGFLNLTHVEKCMSQVGLRHVGVELRLRCGFQDQATVLLSWTLDRTCVMLCTTVKKQIRCGKRSVQSRAETVGLTCGPQHGELKKNKKKQTEAKDGER